MGPPNIYESAVVKVCEVFRYSKLKSGHPLIPSAKSLGGRHGADL